MKRFAPVLVVTAILTFGLQAGAQGSAQRASTPAAPTTTKTADYVEQRVDGDQVVKFTGDELVGPSGGPYGDTIRRPPGIIRVQLIRPRMNFVSELLKSVENL
jgi:hypothetical protein